MPCEVFCVDIGDVILTHNEDCTECQFLPDAVEVLTALNHRRFRDRIRIVSYATEKQEDNVLWWLYQRNFCKKTNISIDNFHFCRKRSDKAAIYTALDATYGVDDRREILTSLHEAKVPNLLLFREREDEKDRYMDVLAYVNQVSSWKEIEGFMQQSA